MERDEIFEEFLKTWKSGHPRYYELLLKAARLHEKKNSDYAGDHDPLKNFRRSEEISIPAWIGCEVRLSDKYSRVIEATKKIIEGKELSVSDEKIEDTFLDLANYSLLCLVLYEEWKINKRKALKG